MTQGFGGFSFSSGLAGVVAVVQAEGQPVILGSDVSFCVYQS